MSKFIKILMFIFLLSLPGYAFASPIYLTLQGTVFKVKDTHGLVSDAGVKVGSVLNYVIKIDSDFKGTTTNKDKISDYGHSSIYGELYKGVLNGNLKKQYNWAKDSDSHFESKVGNQNSYVYFKYKDGGLKDLIVGTAINELKESSDAIHGKADIQLKNVIVTRVADSAPTPIPGAILLMGGGLGLVGLIRRKFVKNS